MLKLFKATIGTNGEWQSIENLPFNSDGHDAGPSLLLVVMVNVSIFVSDMEGTLGDKDIFYVDITKGY